MVDWQLNAHLHNLVPAARNNDRVQDVGAEADAGDPVHKHGESCFMHTQGFQHSPLGVTVLLDVVLALSEGVPELDRPVTGTRDNLPVISAEADGQDIRGVADKAAGGEAGVKVPETEGVVPGRRESKLAVGGDDDVGHEVVVAAEDALGVTVLVVLTRQLPDDDGLVCEVHVQAKRSQNTRARVKVPREAVKIISGFSDEVAMAVTHPLCPAREPR